MVSLTTYIIESLNKSLKNINKIYLNINKIDKISEELNLIILKGTDWSKKGGYTAFYKENWKNVEKIPNVRSIKDGRQKDFETNQKRVIIMKDANFVGKGFGKGYYNIHIEAPEKDGEFTDKFNEDEMDRAYKFFTEICNRGDMIIPAGGTNPGGMSARSKLINYGWKLKCNSDKMKCNTYWSGKANEPEMIKPGGWFEKHPDMWKYKNKKSKNEEPTLKNTIPVSGCYIKK